MQCPYVHLTFISWVVAIEFEFLLLSVFTGPILANDFENIHEYSRNSRILTNINEYSWIFANIELTRLWENLCAVEIQKIPSNCYSLICRKCVKNCDKIWIKRFSAIHDAKSSVAKKKGQGWTV